MRRIQYLKGILGAMYLNKVGNKSLRFTDLTVFNSMSFPGRVDWSVIWDMADGQKLGASVDITNEEFEKIGKPLEDINNEIKDYLLTLNGSKNLEMTL
jgi:hypothetical protein